jgi:uroporphyrinogen-III synthase
MNRRALVLRPEPGASATVARLAAAGLEASAVPLFAVASVAWAVPADGFDALLLTSANAVRHGGDLSAVRHLPVVAVGAATAAAATAAGLDVRWTGAGDAKAAAALVPAMTRLLHLAGRDRVALDGVAAVTVYDSVALPVAREAMAAAKGGVVLLHSARAAARFAELAAELPDVRIAALSAAVAQAAGPGWAEVAVAARPSDATLVETAVSLAIDRRRAPADKQER